MDVKDGMRYFAYPSVEPRLSVDTPARRWVECCSCMEHLDIEETKDAEKWSADHFRVNPFHDRYRVVRQIGWKVTPGAVEPEPATE